MNVCDVCGEKSAHHLNIDRDQQHIDLCSDHLTALIDFLFVTHIPTDVYAETTEDIQLQKPKRGRPRKVN